MMFRIGMDLDDQPGDHRRQEAEKGQGVAEAPVIDKVINRPAKGDEHIQIQAVFPRTAPQTMAFFPTLWPRTASPQAAPNVNCVRESIVFPYVKVGRPFGRSRRRDSKGS